MSYKIFPLGDGALTVDFGNEIAFKLNKSVLELAQYFDKNIFEGFVETVPAYSSLTVFYDVFKVKKNFPEFLTAFEAIESFIENAQRSLAELQIPEPKIIEIPVCFDKEFAPDLDFIAAEANLTNQDVIEIFTGKIYRVFMLGFLPGFSYMGVVDKIIATPRKQTPRVKVAAGSVGIADRQTGIYSLDSPGGWQIVGRTPLRLFTPENRKPTFLSAGDSVKFYKIDKRDFAAD
jgi:inhibitor of KinA